MDCGELLLQQFETDTERAQWLEEGRERMGLPKPTVVEIKENIEHFRQEIEGAQMIKDAEKRGYIYTDTSSETH